VAQALLRNGDELMGNESDHAAEARAVKPLVWANEGDDHAEVDNLGLNYLLMDPSSSDDANGWYVLEEATNTVIESDGSPEGAKAAAQADYDARILSALHSDSPLGAVAIAQDIGKLGDDLTYFPDLVKHGLHTRAYEIAKRAQPTPAELLVAAAELPEVKALVAFITDFVSVCSAIPGARIELALAKQAAEVVAPFARKGE